MHHCIATLLVTSFIQLPLVDVVQLALQIELVVVDDLLDTPL